MSLSRLEKDIFIEALERSCASDRAAYLETACRDNPQLREQVEILIRLHEQTDDYLDLPDDPYPVHEGMGTTVGRYKLLERIGEGGMGVVYLAEQSVPFRRKVAVKIIKPGMDSQQVIARFEAERQALALMDHPNIARVLDAGATESGHPYFVMELVRGIPITNYCDEIKLDTCGRLKLFETVCHGVQHAHQKGIIHRDLKPTNVLITLHDGIPVPKIIDFGIAKATNQQLTERTLFTRFAEMIGTPLYMSPEQAEMSGLDIDTRTDVYSLGVLLYELLTGTTPFDPETLETAGYDEMRRIIREDDPPKPSDRVSTLGADLSTVSDLRSTDPRELKKALRGELDWIVLKSMEKDRTRRYDSASSLAEEVQRFLDNEPVQACPPSRSYRLRKFVRRHKGVVAAMTAITVSLIAGVSGITYGLLQSLDRQAELDSTNRQLVATQSQLLEVLNDEALMAAMSGDFAGTERVIHKARLVGASESWELRMRGLTALYSGQSQTAIDTLMQAVQLEPESVAAHSMLTSAYLYSGEYDAYQRSMLQIRDYHAKSLEDLLFRAQVERSPSAAVESINHVLTERSRWELALAIRGQAKTHLALDTGEAGYLREAIDDIERARDRLEDNAFLLATALFSYQVAIRFGVRERVDTGHYRDKADQIVVQLERYPDYVLGRMTRAWYFDSIGDLDAATNQWQDAIETGGASDLFVASYAAVMYRNGQLQDALAMLERQQRPRGTQAEVARAYVLAALPNGRVRAKRVFLELDQRELPPYSQLNSLTIPLLLGDFKSVEQASSQLLKSDETRLWAGVESIRFLAGEITTDEFIASAGTSNSRAQIAYWLIGLKHLGAGHRELAQQYLIACVDTGYFYTGICHWAKAFLAQLESDSNWPHAVPQDDPSQ